MIGWLTPNSTKIRMTAPSKVYWFFAKDIEEWQYWQLLEEKEKPKE
tara:strand:- start:216 stop:353 length:138 start_codon:yes stop_codon:yes gene_type:complete